MTVICKCQAGTDYQGPLEADAEVGGSPGTAKFVCPSCGKEISLTIRAKFTGRNFKKLAGIEIRKKRSGK
jgi:hypothetical protein